MEVCSKNPNRTAPVAEDSLQRAGVPLCSRTNGWTWPPHPFQLLAWLLYVYFAITGFGVFVPLLPPHWIPAGYICTGVMFTCHLCVHLMAVSVNPADLNVRTKSSRGPVPAFDRSKHAHVIENCHCYLCQVDVGPKSKHCSACNKCVANFDHHCRWLNNCVGSRNYKLFLHSVVSALLGVALVLLVSSYVLVEFFVEPSRLRTDQHFLLRNDSSVWFIFLPVAPLRSSAAVIPGLAAVTITLALLSSVLLSHLLCFHIYLMWNRLSTYEYIVRQRHRQDNKDTRKAGGAAAEVASPSHDLVKDAADCPRTHGYTNPQLDVRDPPSVAVWREAEPLSSSRVRSVSSPVMEDEAPPGASTDAKGAAYTNRCAQKKKKLKKNTHKIPAEKIREHSPSKASSPEFPSVSTVSRAQRLPFPAFPLRASLPPLAAGAGLVQAAAPPAEYHSDSAESLEEIPVALAKLGSSSSAAAGEAVTSFCGGAPGSPPLPPTAGALLRPRTKSRAASSRQHKSAAELRLEVASAHPPVVFVSQASGEGLRGCRRHQPGPRATSRPALAPGGASRMEL